MSSNVHFSVKNSLTQSVDDHVLVFLKPLNASPDFQFAAWQSLDIGTGGTEPFDYVIDIQVAVQREDDGSTSAKVNINPGEVYDAILDNTHGLLLVNEGPNGSNADSVTKTQCGVSNQLSGLSTTVRTLWYVNGSPCVAMPGLNLGASSLFELEPSLYFRAARPTDKGFNFTLQQVSQQTRYVLDPAVANVTATWTRPGGTFGRDTFAFDPPSSTL